MVQPIIGHSSVKDTDTKGKIYIEVKLTIHSKSILEWGPHWHTHSLDRKQNGRITAMWKVFEIIYRNLQNCAQLKVLSMSNPTTMHGSIGHYEVPLLTQGMTPL